MFAPASFTFTDAVDVGGGVYERVLTIDGATGGTFCLVANGLGATSDWGYDWTADMIEDDLNSSSIGINFGPFTVTGTPGNWTFRTSYGNWSRLMCDIRDITPTPEPYIVVANWNSMYRDFLVVANSGTFTVTISDGGTTGPLDADTLPADVLAALQAVDNAGNPVTANYATYAVNVEPQVIEGANGSTFTFDASGLSMDPPA